MQNATRRRVGFGGMRAVLTAVLLSCQASSVAHAAERWEVVAKLPTMYRTTLLEFSSDSTMLLGSVAQGEVRLWERRADESWELKFSTDRESKKLPPRNIREMELQGPATFSPDGKRIAIVGIDRPLIEGGEVLVLVVNTTDGGDRTSFAITGIVKPREMVFKPDGKTLIIAGRISGRGVNPDGRVVVCDCSTGEMRTIMKSDVPLDAVAVSPRGEWCAVGGNKITILSTKTGEELRRIAWTKDRFLISSLAVSPDGRWIASGGYSEFVQVWDAVSGKYMARFAGHLEPDIRSHNSVTGVAFSPDGAVIASTSFTGVVRLWDWKELEELAKLDSDLGTWSVTFSADGKMLAAAVEARRGQRQGEVVIWRRVE